MPSPLWTPSLERQSSSQLASLLEELNLTDYEAAWRWSVDPATNGEFWSTVARRAGVRWDQSPGEARRVDDGSVTGVRWFEGGTLNYAELALADRPDSELAVVGVSDSREEVRWTFGRLREEVGRIQAGLRRRGVGQGDVVAAYLPNAPETLALMLAAAGLGAVFTSCAPEMGATGVLDRFTQASPAILVAVDAYHYGERTRDLSGDAETVRRGLGSLRAAVCWSYGASGLSPEWETWESLTEEAGPAEFTPVPFDHPLYILYSSGTTGKPKAIVHGHGGIALEHAKALAYHFDVGTGDRLFWFTTTGWMMWNFCVSGLLVGASVLLFDGHPGQPEDRLFALMARHGVTVGGVGSAYLAAAAKSGLRPADRFDLSALRTLGATGSPLPAAAARWVYEAVGPDILVASFSGGTDICSGFVGASPLHPVYAGEISCRCLGAPVEVYDDTARPVRDVEGELVLEGAMPSMPVRFLNDPGDERYRASYFERFAGVWAHGDRATLTERGTVIISGRSDGTLNRGGVRMGTAEFYDVVETLPEVHDSLVVHVEDAEGGPGEIWLFVVSEVPLATLEGRIVAALRRELSPRHVPDRIIALASVPRTLSGKKLEVPVKRILAGAAPDEVAVRSSLANPESLDAIAALVERA